jgi:hypothetical protein
MSDSKMIVVEQNRNCVPHRTLMGIARTSASACQPGSDEAPARAWRSQALIALTFTTLSLEGLANSLGEALCPSWRAQHERKSVEEKFKTIRKLLGIEIDWNKPPWSDVRVLMKFRDEIVHPKPEEVTLQRVVPDEELPEFDDIPSSTVEQRMTPENALAAIHTFDAIEQMLYELASAEVRSKAFHDMTIGSRRLAD